MEFVADSSSFLRSRRERQCDHQRGVTLLELAVALTLIGVVAALALPALATPARREGRLDAVLRVSRGASIARAQSLTLGVASDGAWSLRPGTPGDSTRVLGGMLDTAPSAPFQLQLTPLGVCLLSSPLPAEYGGWDAAACAPRRGVASVTGGGA